MPTQQPEETLQKLARALACYANPPFRNASKAYFIAEAASELTALSSSDFSSDPGVQKADDEAEHAYGAVIRATPESWQDLAVKVRVFFDQRERWERDSEQCLDDAFRLLCDAFDLAGAKDCGLYVKVPA